MKIGKYEVVIKDGDNELDQLPDDLPVYNFDGDEVTYGEAKAGYMRNSDYTKKTQGVSEVQKFLQEDLGFQDQRQGVVTMKNVLNKLGQLEEMGILDPTTGEIIAQESKTNQQTPVIANDGDEGVTLDMSMLPTELTQMHQGYEILQRDMGSLMNYITRKEIKDEYPELPGEELEHVMKLSAIDTARSPMEHANNWVEKKKVWGQEAIDKYVEEQKKPKAEGHDRPGAGEPGLDMFSEDTVYTYDPENHDGKKALSPGEAAEIYMKEAMKETD